MRTVSSKDGTRIAYDRLGDGPPVVLVHGGMVQRADNAPLANLLAERFTVINYDRRGRGGSGDTPPGGLAREIEDLETIVAEAGGTPRLYGISSGGALALEAVAAGLPVSRLALYEVPYFESEEMRELGRRYGVDVAKAAAEGRRGDAVELFLGLVGMPPDMIAGMRHAPHWPGMEANALTLPYDAEALGMASRGGAMPEETVASVRVPTLVLDGGASEAWMREAQERIAKTVPNAEYATLEGQSHDVSPDALAPVLARFFS
jgi:pimeloyl-ACP methyl ester carboxylesterase